MYASYYGLRELPFELTPNPRFLYMTQQHREALSILQYGLSMSKPLILLLGEAGMGKTTLIRTALESEECRKVHCVYLCNPTLTRRDFVRALSDHFQLGPAAAESKQTLLRELERLLRERRARGEGTALVVDEAQSLTTALFEEVRLLANIETSSQKLLPVVLAGQPELAARLDHPSLRQLKQRVALRCEIKPFSSTETAAYIANRIRTAGGVGAKLFSLEAVEAIHRHSGGIPRVINVICDNALVTGVAMQRQPVDRAMILEVCRDFALRPAAGAAPVPTADEADEPSPDTATEVAAPNRNGNESRGTALGVSALRRFLSFDGTRW